MRAGDYVCESASVRIIAEAVCWSSYEKMIGTQSNEVSIYNSFPRISHGCHGRAVAEAMLFATYVL